MKKIVSGIFIVLICQGSIFSQNIPELAPGSIEFKESYSKIPSSFSYYINSPDPKDAFSYYRVASTSVNIKPFSCGKMNMNLAEFAKHMQKKISGTANEIKGSVEAAAARYSTAVTDAAPLLAISYFSPTLASFLQNLELNGRLDLGLMVPNCKSMERVIDQGGLGLFQKNKHQCIKEMMDGDIRKLEQATADCDGSTNHLSSFLNSSKAEGSISSLKDEIFDSYEDKNDAIDPLIKDRLSSLLPDLSVSGSASITSNGSLALKGEFYQVKHNVKKTLNDLIDQCRFIMLYRSNKTCKNLKIEDEQKKFLSITGEAGESAQLVDLDLIEKISFLNKGEGQLFMNELSDKITMNKVVNVAGSAMRVLEDVMVNHEAEESVRKFAERNIQKYNLEIQRLEREVANREYLGVTKSRIYNRFNQQQETEKKFNNMVSDDQLNSRPNREKLELPFDGIPLERPTQKAKQLDFEKVYE